MPASTLLIGKILDLLLENADATLIGDAGGLRGSVTPGVFYLGLHTASPGVGGSQNTNEATYTGYARVAVARGAGGWTRAGTTSSNDAAATFPACTAGSDTISHFSLGTDPSGAGNLLGFAALSANRNVSAGITPSFAAGTLQLTMS